MDLIYTNASRVDQGVLLDYDLDLAFGTDENNFECKIIADAHCCDAGSYIYIEGTEYGGIIDSIESDSTNNEVIYKGRTWHGILNSKIIMPDSGKDYLILSGEAKTVLTSLVTRLGLSDLFTVADSQGTIQISNYKVPRYIEAYEGIIKMLNSVSSKLSIAYSNGSCVLRAVPRADYSNDEEFDTSAIPLKVTKNYNTINHLVVLGSGELKNRLVIHLYADADGNISQQQTFTGIEEYSAVYELSSEEDSEKLLEDGTSYFKDLLSTGEIEISLDSDNEDYGISDIFGSYDNITKMFVAEKITKKIVKISDGRLSVEYETKKTTASSAESGGSSGGGSGSSGVDSVNGKTGAVELNAADVGARPDSWMPSAADIGAMDGSFSGVINATLQDGSVDLNSSYKTVQYYKVGDIVTIFFNIKLKNALTDTLLFTLPVGYRPPVTLFSQVVPWSSNANATRYVYVTNNGQFKAYDSAPVRMMGVLTYAANS